MKKVRAAIASVLLLSAAAANGQTDIRGGWIADVGDVRHIYMFKIGDDGITGTYCSRCDQWDGISIIRNGHIEGSSLTFSVFSQSDGGRWQEQRMEGLIGGDGIVVSGGPAGPRGYRLIRSEPPEPRPQAAAPTVAPPPYVPPGPPEPLTIESMVGTWISGSGPRAQILNLKSLDGELVGLICGPCNTPYAMAPVENGTVDGDRVRIFTVHEDWGGAFRELGHPYRNDIAGTVSKYQFRIHANIDGMPNKSVADMTFIGPIRTITGLRGEPARRQD